MKFIVAQVAPQICLTKEDFIAVIDKKIKEITEQQEIDMVLFPEALGLWLCLMEPKSKLSKIFLHTHQQNTVKISNLNYDIDNSDEIIANIQFAKPEKPNIEPSELSGKGLLDCLPIYKDIVKTKSFQNKLGKFADWLFSKISLRFISQYLRSNEILTAYKEAFSLAAKKYNVYIQAGSIFERVIGGTKNVAYTFAPDGSIVCRQEKWHPIPFEGMLGIKAGNEYQTFEVAGVKCGIAICADLNYPNDIVDKLAKDGCKFIAGPSGGIVPSHGWNFDYKRDIEDCQQARANESGVIIGRPYNAGDLIGGILKFQGRSSIVKPGELVAIVPESKIKESYILRSEI